MERLTVKAEKHTPHFLLKKIPLLSINVHAQFQEKFSFLTNLHNISVCSGACFYLHLYIVSALKKWLKIGVGYGLSTYFFKSNT